MYDSLIDAESLNGLLMNDEVIIVDCRYDLMNKLAGRQAYLKSHIKSAVYADLHDDLSGPPVTNKGRHPLLTEEAHRQLFSRLGIDTTSQVVAYDASGGAFAARLWWMLRYMGHDEVAVLNGGWQAWQAFAGAVEAGAGENTRAVFTGEPQNEWLVEVEQVMQQPCLIDSREPPRYRGEVEPIDPVAGHIPGARNRFFKNNLQEDGHYKASEVLKNELDELLNPVGVKDTVFYCGSGVTACHNILACYHATGHMPRLYAGSWSEWSSDSTRPVETSSE